MLGERQTQEEHQQGDDHHRRLREAAHFCVAHEFQRGSDAGETDDDEHVQRHVQTAAALAAPVQKPVVDVAVAEEEAGHDEEGGQREIQGFRRETVCEVFRDDQDHVAESEHDVEHDALGEMGEVGGDPRQERGRREADEEGPLPGGEAGKVIDGDRSCDQASLDEQQGGVLADVSPAQPVFRRAQHPQILRGEVDQDQCPGAHERAVVRIPAVDGVRAHDVQQEHVYEHHQLVRDAVLSEAVHEQRRPVPDLEHDQGTDEIVHKCLERDETRLHAVEQGRVPADQVHEDQIVDQLDLLDLFLFPKNHSAASVRGSIHINSIADLRAKTSRRDRGGGRICPDRDFYPERGIKRARKPHLL